MDNKIILIAVMVVLVIGEPLTRLLFKKYYLNKVSILFTKKDFKAIDALLDRKFVKFIFEPYNIEYLKLNEAMLSGSKKHINQQFEILSKMKLKEKQKEDVYLNAFNYYLSEEDDKNANKYYRLIKTLKNENLIKNVEISYDVFVNEGYKYIDDVLKEYSICPESEKFINEYLLSIMYKNKGDKQKFEYYDKLANEHKTVA